MEDAAFDAKRAASKGEVLDFRDEPEGDEDIPESY